jgi:hypothetical protein
VGSTEHEAPAHTLVMVPIGAPHTFANLTDETVVLLNTFTRISTCSTSMTKEMIADGPPSPEATVATMVRFATEPATDYANARNQADA